METPSKSEYLQSLSMPRLSVRVRLAWVCLVLHLAGAAQTFGTSLKGVWLHHGVEQVVYTRGCAAAEAPCAMQHWWSGGTFAGYPETVVRYYVDGAAAPVEMPLGLAHGQGDETEDNGPWSAGTLTNSMAPSCTTLCLARGSWR